ncbi:hypothetical protein Tco_1254558 [Tanacetum coccineum]
MTQSCPYPRWDRRFWLLEVMLIIWAINVIGGESGGKKDKASISSLSTRGGKMGGLGKLVTSQNSVETKLINWSQYKERGSIPIWSNYFKKQDGGESELQQASVSSTKLISISDKRMSTLLNNPALAKRWHLNFLAVVHYKHIREITFGVLTKIDLMDKETDVVDWEKNYYISSIAGSNNGSSLCGHVKRNPVFTTILQNTVCGHPTIRPLHHLLQIDADTLQVGPLDEDEENQCIRLLSFCKRHSPNRSIERVAPDERMGQLPSQQSDNVIPSGCARTDERYSNLSKTLEAAKHEFLEWKRKYEVALSKQKAGEKQASSVIANLKARSSAAEARLTAAREQTLSAQEEAGEWKRKYGVVVKEAKSALEKTAKIVQNGKVNQVAKKPDGCSKHLGTRELLRGQTSLMVPKDSIYRPLPSATATFTCFTPTKAVALDTNHLRPHGYLE